MSGEEEREKRNEERIDPQVTDAIRNWVNEGLAHVRGCDPGANAQRCTCGYVEVRELLRFASPAAFDPPSMTQTSALKHESSSKTAFRVAWEAWNLVASMDEHAAAQELLDVAIGDLDGDELDVVGAVIDRLKLGRGIYGQWVAAKDMRDHAKEALDEELDDVVYRAMRSIIARRRESRSLKAVPK